jgi:hypothetical protein
MSTIVAPFVTFIRWIFNNTITRSIISALLIFIPYVIFVRQYTHNILRDIVTTQSESVVVMVLILVLTSFGVGLTRRPFSLQWTLYTFIAQLAAFIVIGSIFLANDVSQGTNYSGSYGPFNLLSFSLLDDSKKFYIEFVDIIQALIYVVPTILGAVLIVSVLMADTTQEAISSLTTGGIILVLFVMGNVLFSLSGTNLF